MRVEEVMASDEGQMQFKATEAMARSWGDELNEKRC
jgi:hypothetical protein